MVFDEIIVGAGSSGAVVAARLSEDQQRQVLLIEAGPDYPDITQIPPSLLESRRPAADHDWGLIAEMIPGRSVPYARAKVVGGCSSVNSCLALRGTPEDYDEWAALGNSEWSWADVLPYFIAVEDDPQGAREVHGTGGPVPVRRYAYAELWPLQSALVAACQALGFNACDDHNHPDATGVGSGQRNVDARDMRVSTARGYLAQARQRSNFRIWSNCLVARVLFEGTRACGVEVEENGARRIIRGRRVTLSAGTIGTPAILLRSGVGPADDIKAVGIECWHALHGIGRNLVDHPMIGLVWNATPDLTDLSAPLFQVLLRYTAPSSRHRNDIQVLALQGLSQPMFQIAGALMKPLSSGTLQLRSAEPSVQPDIRLNLASHPEDIRRLRDCVRLLGQLVCTPQLATLGSHNLAVIDGEEVSADQFAALAVSSEWTDAFVQRVVRHYVHPVGTARMGPANDHGAVVNQHGRVHGLSCLRVADASIMPTIPRANTHLTCVMIGERVARWMREQAE